MIKMNTKLCSRLNVICSRESCVLFNEKENECLEATYMKAMIHFSNHIVTNSMVVH